VVILMAWAAPTQAGDRDRQDYERLAAELGTTVPTGAGARVAQVEVGSSYLPDPSDPDFLSPYKHFVDASGTAGGHSNHPTCVGKRFYGNETSMAPGIGTSGPEPILLYEVNDWLGAGYLQTGMDALPLTTVSRVTNHGWVGDSARAGEILRRLDFVVEEDDALQLVGVPNSGSCSLPSGAFNVISVGMTNGSHTSGTVGVDSVYTSGRVAPTVVAMHPTQVSFTVPQVSAACALLLETATDASLSSGTTANRTRTIQHAETSEVIKAALMTGADRYVINHAASGDLTDYAIDTTNNLDSRYGAGQLNIYHSYKILAAGEQDSVQDGGGPRVGTYGWDYDSTFGGAAGSSRVASYFFTGGESSEAPLVASLVWNIDVDIRLGPGYPRFFTELHDLDLLLLDVSRGGETIVASSASAEQNTENLFFEGVVFGRAYELRVVAGGGQSDFLWDYGLAWRIPEPPTPGDTNRDGEVDFRDYMALKHAFGRSGDVGWSDGDFDANGCVDRADFLLLRANFGSGESPSSPVPGPATLWLLGPGALLLTRRRRLRWRGNTPSVLDRAAR